jgi:hypothetical protein
VKQLGASRRRECLEASRRLRRAFSISSKVMRWTLPRSIWARGVLVAKVHNHGDPEDDSARRRQPDPQRCRQQQGFAKGRDQPHPQEGERGQEGGPPDRMT